MSTIVPELPTRVIPAQEEKTVPMDLTVDRQPGLVLREQGVLMMTKAFNQENCEPLTRAILEYNLLPEDKRPPVIRLYINSPGGEVFHAKQLIDTIKQSRIPVHTINSGIAASCGCLLLMSGHRRFATVGSQTMSHVYSAGSGGKEMDLMARVNSFKMTSAFMVNHYRECTGKSEEYIRKHLLPPEDVWLSAEEALEHNIIDEIIDIYDTPIVPDWKAALEPVKEKKKKKKKSKKDKA